MALEYRTASRRETGADLEAHGEAELFQLSDATLERRHVSVYLRREHARNDAGLVGDELQVACRPGRRARGVDPGQPRDDSLELGVLRQAFPDGDARIVIRRRSSETSRSTVESLACAVTARREFTWPGRGSSGPRSRVEASARAVERRLVVRQCSAHNLWKLCRQQERHESYAGFRSRAQYRERRTHHAIRQGERSN